MSFPFRIPTWAFFALGAMVLILGPVAIALPRYTTSSPDYCLSCHGGGDTPNRGIESLVHPRFDRVGCTDCHAEPNQVVYEGYRQGFGSEPERVSPNCITCHPDITKRNDQVGFKKNVMRIQVPHKLHYDLGAKCTDCHANIAHDLKEPQTNRPRMEYCSQCHAATTEACAKCHGDSIPPGPIPAAPPAGMVADGRALYSRYCVQCHGRKGDLVATINLSSNEYLTKQGVLTLQRLASEGHGGMPAFGKAHGGPLTDDEIRAVIAHLKLAAEGPGAAKGDILYDKNCVVCHGAKGDKMSAANLAAPEFVRTLSDEAMVKAISEGRGGMPAFGKPKGGSLSFDEIVAVERYATTLAKGSESVTTRALYTQYCSSCHGDGNLVKIADLSSREFISQRGDANLAKSTAEGKGGMPAFGKTKGGQLSDDQIQSILQYLKGKVGLVAPPVPKAIPHTLTGRDNCITCHGPGGTKPVPVDHQGRSNDVCQLCHKPVGAAPAPSAKAIPHSLAGRERCLGCHAVGGYKPAPADHVGRDNDLCQACHKPATNVVAPTPAPGTQPPASIAPPIPHPVAGEANCLTCHATGGLKPVPASHVGRGNELCQVCHAPK